MKYGPEELYDVTSTILNNIFRRNHSTIKLGTGILLPLPKPKKPTGPLKNLRPITLLEVIRKVLSKIFMNITEVHTGKGEALPMLCGIDIASAFDTIYRGKLIKIATEILDDDEIRILRVLLSETTLEVKVKGAEPKLFVSNIGSPQGDSISGPLFTIYFERALRELETIVDNVPIDVRDINPQCQWIERDESHLPEEIEYADDCDFMTEDEKRKEVTYHKAKEMLTKYNLVVNEDKTENTVVKRGKKAEEEAWRNVVKLGSKLDDREEKN